MALTKITSTNIGANAVTSSALSNTAIIAALGHTPANKAGDTFTGSLFVRGDPVSLVANGVNCDITARASTSGYASMVIDGYSNSYMFLKQAGADVARITANTTNLALATGASNIDRLVIDASGRITMPYQSLAVVGRSGGDVASQTSPIPYNETITNVGNCWNGSTYRFTAQVAGYYYMSINALANNSTGVEVAIRKNGSATVVNTRGYGNGTSCSAAGIIYLAVGDYVDAKVEGSYAMNGGNGYAYSGMTVYLLG